MSLAILWGVLLSVLAVLLEELHFNWYKKWYYTVTLILFAVLENIGYRQLSVLWRMKGFYDYLRGRNEWGDMPRKGFQKAN
ncbi:hypothetical protein ACFL4D_00610 [Candidatus Margulisiibacteriota bacterium]